MAPSLLRVCSHHICKAPAPFRLPRTTDTSQRESSSEPQSRPQEQRLRKEFPGLSGKLPPLRQHSTLFKKCADKMVDGKHSTRRAVKEGRAALVSEAPADLTAHVRPRPHRPGGGRRQTTTPKGVKSGRAGKTKQPPKSRAVSLGQAFTGSHHQQDAVQHSPVPAIPDNAEQQSHSHTQPTLKVSLYQPTVEDAEESPLNDTVPAVGLFGQPDALADNSAATTTTVEDEHGAGGSTAITPAHNTNGQPGAAAKAAFDIFRIRKNVLEGLASIAQPDRADANQPAQSTAPTPSTSQPSVSTALTSVQPGAGSDVLKMPPPALMPRPSNQKAAVPSNTVTEDKAKQPNGAANLTSEHHAKPHSRPRIGPAEASSSMNVDDADDASLFGDDPPAQPEAPRPSLALPKTSVEPRGTVRFPHQRTSCEL
ncbi:hypothetical protein BAUCODRAFT_126985 [Baudoinia panamericana UAMH 10762]|uniref:Uncharacterized protein n=1 Tax=Baudoinia panamericana (strain UAMH 10762) TaxID=717646 RepID=M2LB73_BAUPA|nr:uncharacterized protein BAUCODRAFT_126985 [Baudoinia panamericana UAMH 10762]EMC91062.1 hypothetical protein BAUCODRAFT_126985 [Baudoinia panamericana UAMH 10762]